MVRFGQTNPQMPTAVKVFYKTFDDRSARALGDDYFDGPTMTLPLDLAAVIGIDWADDHHDVALQAHDSATVDEFRLAHTPEAIHQWLAALAARFGGRSIGIAIETSRGPLVHALLDAPFIVLYPINPRSLRRFRETFSPNGAKDDRPDARLLLTLLLRHRDALVPWQPDAPATRLLRRLVERRRAAVELRTQLTLQLQSVLKEYFPQALDWAGDDLSAAMASDFLTRWPTLAAVQRARPTTVRGFYTAHGCRRAARLEQRLAAMRTAVPLTDDVAVVTSNVLTVHLLVAQLRTVAPHLDRLDREIATCFAQHADAALFRALPGAGAALAPRLLAVVGTDRRRFPAATDLQQHAGIAPVTVRSGRQHHVHWRWATSTFVRQTFHEFAHHSVQHCRWARAFYRQQRERGKSHHVAVRALAFKWIRIIWRCWQDRTPYDGAHYERALEQRNSPVFKLLNAA
jgi:transposase